MPQATEDQSTDLVDAVALLKSDHRKVEDLFVQYEAADDAAAKEELSSQICMELKIHTMIEEEIFYPSLRGKIDDDTLDEAHVEHDGAKVLINDIAAGNPDDDYIDAKVTVLKEEVKHHVKEEEMPDTGMFAQARATDVDLNDLGVRMKARKQELMAMAMDQGLPVAVPSVVNLVTG